MSDTKECFFIAPIDEQGSEVRNRTDNLMEYIVEEAVSDFDYSVVRADKMDQPGSITNQIIQKLIESDLVIADLTGHNPNVFYELAVRHATGEPCLQLIQSDDSIPFDINDERTIKYGLNVEEADQAREAIRSQLKQVEEGQNGFDNPISRSAEMKSLRESSDPDDQRLANILDSLSRLDRKVDQIERYHSNKSQESLSSYRNPDKTRIMLGDVQYTTTANNIPEDQVKTMAEKSNLNLEQVKQKLTENNIEIRDNSS